MLTALERVTANMKTLETQSRGADIDGVIQLLQDAYLGSRGLKDVKPDETFSKEDYDELSKVLIRVSTRTQDVNHAITSFTEAIENLDKVLIALKAGGHPTKDLEDALDTLTERAKMLLCNRLK